MYTNNYLFSCSALSNMSGGIYPHGRPIVVLGMSSMLQRPAAWMISAYPIMEFCQYVLSLLVSETLKIGPNLGTVYIVDR